MPKYLPVLLLLWVTPALASVVESVSVVVDDYVITQGEVDEYVLFQSRIIGRTAFGPEQAKEELIDKVLVEKEAQRRGLIPDDQELQQALDEIRSRNKMNEAQFLQALSAQGMGYDEYAAQVRSQMVQARLTAVVLREQLSLDDDALREYYLKNVASYCDSPALRLIHIRIPDEQGRERAEEVRRQVQEAGDAAVAGEFGDITDMGEVLVDNLHEDVRAVLENLPPGEVSEVVEMQGACNLFYVAERKEGRIRPFEEVRDQIREQYLRDKEEELFRRWLDGARDETRIVRKPEG